MTASGLRLDRYVCPQIQRASSTELLGCYDSLHLRGVDLLDRVDCLANRLSEAGIIQGDRLAIVCGNHPDAVIAWLAASVTESVVIPMSAASSQQVLTAHFTTTRPAAALVDDTTAAAVQDTGIQTTLLYCGDDFPHRTTAGRPAPTEWTLTRELDTCAVRMSSGTTGEPRGLLVSHRSMVLTIMAEALEVGIRPGDRLLIALPLQGAGSWFALAALAMTATVTLLSDPRYLPSVDLSGFTHLITVPELLRRTEPPNSSRAPKLQVVTTGAAIPEQVRKRWAAAGSELWDIYGSTESAIVSSRRPNEDNSGHPWFNAEVRAGQSVSGPIAKRGPDVFTGYLESVNGSPYEMTLEQEWIATGDLGMLRLPSDELTVEGRADDIAVVNGNNVNPAELERILTAATGVADLAIACEKYGDFTMIIVYVVASNRGIETIEAACRECLPKNMRPRRLRRVSTLPRNDFGKLQRFRLGSGEILSERDLNDEVAQPCSFGQTGRQTDQPSTTD